VDVIAQWRPREKLTAEDALSRVPDASDWGLAPRAFRMVVQAFGEPHIDLFASDTWHVAPVFISPRYMPGCSAVDAFNVDWKDLVAPRSLAWLFPPVRAISKALQLLKKSHIDAIIIVLEAPTTNWWIALLALGAEARVEGPIQLERSIDICIFSRRVPSGTVNPALFKSREFKITW
jgi:hypothetical protein